jgi:hypothetical protein
MFEPAVGSTKCELLRGLSLFPSASRGEQVRVRPAGLDRGESSDVSLPRRKRGGCYSLPGRASNAGGSLAQDRGTPPRPRTPRARVSPALKSVKSCELEDLQSAARESLTASGMATARARHHVRSFGVLTLLADHGPLSQQTIGEQLRIDRTTMVAMIGDLEQAGPRQARTQPARPPRPRSLSFVQAVRAPGRRPSQPCRALLEVRRPVGDNRRSLGRPPVRVGDSGLGPLPDWQTASHGRPVLGPASATHSASRPGAR